MTAVTGLSGCTVKSESRPECCVHLGTYLPSQYSSQYSSPFPHCRFSPTEGRCPPEPAAGVTHRSLFNLPSHNNFSSNIANIYMVNTTVFRFAMVHTRLSQLSLPHFYYTL
ncbi:hypothetical protein J6590_082889 [Homalodisca vitripennis]|nr:hypothetical protein J6590_082889 [Homalodisca vitripennis]